jgi:predicted aldo/keto reductase-like oxidoreductase
MKYRKMGSLGWEVSALGFGAMRLPVDDQSHVNETEAISMIRHAIEQGVNYVDTAYPYHNGESEVVVGKALQEGFRERVYLTTKLPIWAVRKRSHFERYFKRQVKRLQSNPDLYLFHGLNAQRFEKVIELNLIDEMESLRDEGIIKHFGFSFHDSYDTFKKIIDHYQWDCCQIQLNYLDVEYQAGVKGLQYAAKKGIAVIIMEPIMGGKLAIPDKHLDDRVEVKQVLDEAPIKRSMADWALQFLWNMPEVSVVLSGMSNIQQVIENCQSADTSGIGNLSEDDLNIIAGLRKAFKAYNIVPCTSCGYCTPCPNGVSIPYIMRFVNDLAYWGDRSKERIENFYNRMAKTPEELHQRVESGEESDGSAALCTHCEECLEKCPQQINIPDIMDRMNGIFKEGKKISEAFEGIST